MNANLCIPLECPYCGEYDTCYTDCGCPSCCDASPEEIHAWIQLAPVIVAIVDRDGSWYWDSKTFRICDIEKPHGNPKDDFEVSIHNGSFLVTQETIVCEATYLEPREWGFVADFVSDDPQAIADWIMAQPVWGSDD
jgi:hypothetical protein